VAKTKRRSPSDLIGAAVAETRSGPRQWFDTLPAADQQYINDVMVSYAAQSRRPSIRTLHKLLDAEVGLPVKHNAFADFVNRWMTSHVKKTAG
jgi:hypothetical protein